MTGSVRFRLPMGRGANQTVTPEEVSQPSQGRQQDAGPFPAKTRQSPLPPPDPLTPHSTPGPHVRLQLILQTHGSVAVSQRGAVWVCTLQAGRQGASPGGGTERPLRSLGERRGRGPVLMELSPLRPARTPRCQPSPSGVPPDAQSCAQLLCVCKAVFIFRLHLQGTE